MKLYHVSIEAEDENGRKTSFTEVVEYNLDPRDPSSCIPEDKREARGVAQAKERMPHLKNVRATGSISP